MLRVMLSDVPVHLQCVLEALQRHFLLLRNRNLLLFFKSNKKSLLLPLYTTTLVWVEWSCDADS